MYRLGFFPKNMCGPTNYNGTGTYLYLLYIKYKQTSLKHWPEFKIKLQLKYS